MNEFEDQPIPEGYKLVYQGGHHNVYCNGATHKFSTGGYTKCASIRFVIFSDKPCDCTYWKQFNEAMK